MSNFSYWEATSLIPPADYLILGGGLVGLSTALHLKIAKPKARILVLERGPLPNGASTKNAGFACIGSLSELTDDARTESREAVVKRAGQRYRGLQKLRSILGDQALGFQAIGNIEVFKIHYDNPTNMRLWNEALAEELGLKEVFKIGPKIKELGLRNFLGTTIINTAEGCLDTGKMMYNLLRFCQKLGVEFIGGIEVEAYEESGQKVILHSKKPSWRFETQQLIVATNGFTHRLFPELNIKPARNQVWCTEVLADLPWSGCFHYNKGYVYFRNIGKRILLGGGRDLDLEGEATDEAGESPVIQAFLGEFLSQHLYPSLPKIDYAWSGILGFGSSKQPLVKALSNRITAAVGLGGMGVALGASLGEEAAQLSLSLGL